MSACVLGAGGPSQATKRAMLVEGRLPPAHVDLAAILAQPPPPLALTPQRRARHVNNTVELPDDHEFAAHPNQHCWGQHDHDDDSNCCHELHARQTNSTPYSGRALDIGGHRRRLGSDATLLGVHDSSEPTILGIDRRDLPSDEGEHRPAAPLAPETPTRRHEDDQDDYQHCEQASNADTGVASFLGRVPPPPPPISTKTTTTRATTPGRSPGDTHVAAVYEQPALEKRLSALASVKGPSRGTQDQFGSMPRQVSTFKRERRIRNSLESIQSRFSTSSATATPTVPPVALAAAGHSVLVATRYVSPPVVPPPIELIAKTAGENDPEQQNQWQEVPLEGLEPRPGGPKRASLMSSLVRSLKSGGGGGTAGKSSEKYQLDGRGQAGGQRDSRRASANRSPPPPAFEKPEKGLQLSKSFDEDEQERREKKRRGSSNGRKESSAAARKHLEANQPASPNRQIGKARAPFLFAGILGSILGSLFFSLGMLTTKLLPDGHGLAEKNKIVCFRGFMITLLCAATILHQKSTFIVRRDELFVNVLRAILGFTGVFGTYISLKYISMGDSTALIFSSPVWTSLLSHFILNEPLQWIQLLALPLSILGIILIAHPSLLINMGEHTAGFSERQPLIDLVDVLPAGNESSSSSLAEALLAGPPLSHSPPGVAAPNATTATNATSQLAQLAAQLNQDLDIAINTNEHFDYEHRWKGIAIALGTSFIVSFVYIVLKFRKTTPIQTTTFWLGVTTIFGALTLGCFIGFGEWPRGWTEWSLLVFNGVCSWLGQCLLQWGLKYEDASVLSVVRTLDVAMTFTLSALFLEEEILWTSILGASIIAGVVVSIMLNNYISSKLCPRNEASSPDGNSGGSLRSSVTLSTGEGSGELELGQDSAARKGSHPAGA